jgi:hypothetical protein
MQGLILVRAPALRFDHRLLEKWLWQHMTAEWENLFVLIMDMELRPRMAICPKFM